MRCWKGGCRNDIIGEINAQWTVADFHSYTTCEAHWYEGMARLERKQIDGVRPAEAWLARYAWPIPWAQAELPLDWQA